MKIEAFTYIRRSIQLPNLTAVRIYGNTVTTQRGRSESSWLGSRLRYYIFSAVDSNWQP